MAMLVGIAVTAGIAVVAGVALTATDVVLRNAIDDQLLVQAQAAVKNAQFIVQRKDPYNPYDDEIVLGVTGIGGQHVQLIRPDGAVVQPAAMTHSYVRLPVDSQDALIAASQSGQRLRTVKVNGEEYRVATVAAYYSPMDLREQDIDSDRPLRLALQLARPMDDVTQTLRDLGLIMLVVGVIGVLGSMLAGLLVARAALKPVDAAADAAEHVARTQDLSALIPVTGTDEIARFAVSLNSMLRALEASKARQRQLIDDASHELRTPLTSLRTNVELLIRSEANPTRALPAADRTALLHDVDAQMRELTGLVSELVELARDEAPVEEIERFDLAGVVEAAVTRARRRATVKGIVIELTAEPSWVDGRPNMLERAVTNLLDNAVKFSPADSTVRVHTAAGEVVVSDEGPGIAPADRPHVFERFYRSTDARSLPGSGLGLAIVADAAHTHGGTVTAGQDPGGGARLRLWLPVAAAPLTEFAAASSEFAVRPGELAGPRPEDGPLGPGPSGAPGGEAGHPAPVSAPEPSRWASPT
ncbi:HAMP domain-containing histidine kinase [Frankia sp. CNm7]|uniref:histidine kinase n=2 Tax=Frankia nepalensis TaxID=1836974 RepID=A0A937RBK5_9ACTN|nr:HAMP domain-containing sensor histidine kinase [Frankia nepalensis]MBL7495419.1 HAMP domain-containing histidine kinase [Frankia nepalensis]MBL7515523.1 HAMP domain-containing histidine kinase [Frankia nepalensis]MBL7518901.1 HAMP domain-containing histidine kinase [Frankia nepalensis]MBL7625975.1 HAMP domain-containing histidine kinase [Frankia nepalensis]